jgi:hypothetical protein
MFPFITILFSLITVMPFILLGFANFGFYICWGPPWYCWAWMMCPPSIWGFFISIYGLLKM